MRKASVAAATDAAETTSVPGTTPKMTPEVIVSGMAGTASSSRPTYTAPYAAYLHSQEG